MLVAAVFVPLSLSAGQDADLACDHGRQETPAAEDTCRVVFRFSPKKLMFQAPFRGNETGIARLTEMIRQHRDSIEAGRAKIRVEGYCPSFGSVEANLAAAKNRSNQVKSYFITHERLREEHFRTFNSARAWNGQHDVVVVAYCMTGDRAADKRTAGAPGREGSISSGMGAARVGDDDTGGSTAGSVSPAVSLPDGPESGGPPDTPDDAPGSGNLSPGAVAAADRPVRETAPAPSFRMAVKTNLAVWAATVANLGVEFGFGRHYSVDVPVIYSPYTVRRVYRMNLFAVQPEFRYWLDRPFRGHFFGLHLHSGGFNIAVDARTRYQDCRPFWGAGISYGYVVPLNRCWGAEFTLGAGFVNVKYDQFYNIPNGARYGHGLTHTYWGVTRAGITLLYRFGFKKEDR